ncbi:cation:proton antiporter [Streptomyces roseifaciens]
MLSQALAQGVPALVAATLVLTVARAAGRAARLLHQPMVIGEVAAGLLFVPAMSVTLGRSAVAVLLPPGVRDALDVIGEVGLVLFLAAVAHKIRCHPVGMRGRSLAWVVAGTSVPAFACGALVAAWLTWQGSPALRGSAPSPALALLLADAFMITAVPVLARLLEDRAMARSSVGSVAMTAALAVDVIGWFVLALAIGWAANDLTDAAGAATAAVAMAGAAVALHYALRSGPAHRLRAEAPAVFAAGLACLVLAVAAVGEHHKLTGVPGALLVGLALPPAATPRHDRAMRALDGFGRFLVPVYFVTTGIHLLARPLPAAPCMVVLVVAVLAVAGKAAGTYAGAWIAGYPQAFRLRLTVLMNIRGLTELVLLQVGYTAGILTASLFLVLAAVALISTAVAGPLLTVIDGCEAKAGQTGTSRQKGRRQ